MTLIILSRLSKNGYQRISKQNLHLITLKNSVINSFEEFKNKCLVLVKPENKVHITYSRIFGANNFNITQINLMTIGSINYTMM